MLGGCHCGAIRYRVEGKPKTHTLCHCSDCRWAMFPQQAVKVEKGSPKVYRSSGHGRRHFCPECGTGLFYINEQVLPGIIDVQSATFDDPAAYAPQAHIQIADRINWMARAHELPTFDRYPPQS